MWRVKELFDPEHVLNPGVLLNRDPDCHRKFFKPSPEASEIVNRCAPAGALHRHLTAASNLVFLSTSLRCLLPDCKRCYSVGAPG
jgi:hypothetical protein